MRKFIIASIACIVLNGTSSLANNNKKITLLDDRVTIETKLRGTIDLSNYIINSKDIATEYTVTIFVKEPDGSVQTVEIGLIKSADGTIGVDNNSVRTYVDDPYNYAG
jgi:hypothetical protein